MNPVSVNFGFLCPLISVIHNTFNKLTKHKTVILAPVYILLILIVANVSRKNGLLHFWYVCNKRDSVEIFLKNSSFLLILEILNVEVLFMK